jgi:hypothetical protein
LEAKVLFSAFIWAIATHHGINNQGGDHYNSPRKRTEMMTHVTSLLNELGNADKDDSSVGTDTGLEGLAMPEDASWEKLEPFLIIGDLLAQPELKRDFTTSIDPIANIPLPHKTEIIENYDRSDREESEQLEAGLGGVDMPLQCLVGEIDRARLEEADIHSTPSDIHEAGAEIFSGGRYIIRCDHTQPHISFSDRMKTFIERHARMLVD